MRLSTRQVSELLGIPLRRATGFAKRNNIEKEGRRFRWSFESIIALAEFMGCVYPTVAAFEVMQEGGLI